MAGRRILAAELGMVIWRVPQLGVLVHHTVVGEVLRYDTKSRPGHSDHSDTHEFARDMLRRDAKSEVLVEKWRDAVLVYPDGSEEPMDPLRLRDAANAWRETKMRRNR